MYKKKKKYRLNTSNKAHTYLMLRNLFTSLLLHKKLVTTVRRAKTLRDYAQKMLVQYSKIEDPWQKKRWINANILTRKYLNRIKETLEQAKKEYKITLKAVGFRNGDGSLMYEVELVVPKTQEDTSKKEEATSEQKPNPKDEKNKGKVKKK